MTMAIQWRYVETGSQSAAYNLALEEALLNALDADGETGYFLLWQNSPSVVIGRHQNVFSEVNITELRKRSIGLLRRLTGGGAVYHDLGNINFSFIVPQNDKVQVKQDELLMPLIDSFKNCGLEVNFQGRNDLSIGNGGKFSGLASLRQAGKYLLHGTIMHNVELDFLELILLVDPAKYKSKGVASLRARVTNLKDYFSMDITELWSLLKNSYPAEAYVPPEEIKQAAQHLLNDKYSQDWWNLGQSPASDIFLKKRFNFGTLELYLSTKKNKIYDAKLTGDFFAAINCDEPIPPIVLEKALVGLPADDGALLGKAWGEYDLKCIFFGLSDVDEVLDWLTLAI